MNSCLRILLLLLLLPFTAVSQTAIWGAQAGPIHASRWEKAFGITAVIGAATEKLEVTGQVGVAGENFFRTFNETLDHDDHMAHALLMIRFGRPAWMGFWPFAGTGIGVGVMDEADGKHRELILTILELGIRRRFLHILQAGAALEIQEFERYQMAIRMNFAVGPFRRP